MAEPSGACLPLISRVRIKNFKSIGEADISLDSLNILVGRNGAGKSNVLDAIRFVSDSLQTSLANAIASRGGIDDVRRRSTGHPYNFTIGLVLDVDRVTTAKYQFEVKAQKDGGFSVKQELLEVEDPGGKADYKIESGELRRTTEPVFPAVSEDRLALVAASGLPVFRKVYDALISVGFYNLNPSVMREIQAPDAGELLRRDGGNIASVVRRLKADAPSTAERIQEFLHLIVPGIADFEPKKLGHRETIEFRQDVAGSKYPWMFSANNMSDGTLRVLGILVAVMQHASATDSPIRLVGIEEPETALHPAVAASMIGALKEAATTTQVLVTTHSPDLLEHYDLDDQNLLVVVNEDGTTRIAPPDEYSKRMIQEHLISPGELLRQGQLLPEPAVESQGDLFDWRLHDAG